MPTIPRHPDIAHGPAVGDRSRVASSSSSPRSARRSGPTRLGGRDVIDGFGADEWSHSGRGQVLAPVAEPARRRPVRVRRRRRPRRRSTSPSCATPSTGWSAGCPGGSRPTPRTSSALSCPVRPTPGYPFTLDLRIEYRLGRDGLTVSDDRGQRRRRRPAVRPRLPPVPDGRRAERVDSAARSGCRPPSGWSLDARALPDRRARSRSPAPSTTSPPAGRSGRPGWTPPSPASSGTARRPGVGDARRPGRRARRRPVGGRPVRLPHVLHRRHARRCRAPAHGRRHRADDLPARRVPVRPGPRGPGAGPAVGGELGAAPAVTANAAGQPPVSVSRCGVPPGSLRPGRPGGRPAS